MINKKVYNKLIEIARAKKTITYSELSEECGLFLDFDNINDRNKISSILGEISKYEVKKGGPMLSSLVVLKNSHPQKPAFGFYTYADELEVRKKGESDQQLFWRQLKECYKHWE